MKLVKLADTWQMWPWLWLRGAGFSVEDVLSLAVQESLAALQRYREADADFQKACEAAIQALATAIEARAGSDRRPFSKAILKLRKGNVPPHAERLAEAASSVQVAQGLHDERAQKWAELERVFAKDNEVVAQRLSVAASAPLFREAVAWQNPDGLRTGIDKLQAHSDGKYLRLAANYLQRYCTKNDTIGFFGPVSWGQIVATEPCTTPGPGLIAQRKVLFSAWAIDTLAAHLSEDFELKKWLAPRRLPSVLVVGNTLRHGAGEELQVEREVAYLLSQADGQTPAAQLVASALANDELDFDDASDVYDLLEELQDKPLLRWQIEIPYLSSHPEEYLREALASAGKAGTPGLLLLARLEEGRARLVQSQGDADATVLSLEKLSGDFEEMTGARSIRNEGATYGGRTIVFEDTVRDFTLRLPETLFRAIGPALSLVLQSARWCSHEVAARYRQAFRNIHQELGGGQLPYLQFFARVSDILPTMVGPGSELVGEVISKLRARWTAILGLSANSTDIQVESQDIAAAVQASFAAPCAGWPSARFHSPDLLFATPALDSVLPLDALVILGELHASTITVFSEAVTHHDCPIRAQAVELYERYSPIHVETVVPNERAGRATGRSMSARDYQVEIGTSKSANHRDRVIAAADLVVEATESSLRVRSRDGRHSFDVVAFFEYQLAGAVASRFSFIDHADYSPRIRIDNLVIARESWNFAVEGLPFAKEPRGVAQFVGVQDWRARARLPRFLFAKASGERKPLFVDLDSPLAIELLCNQLRKSEVVAITEMLPSFGENWLRDAEGKPYTSEIRTIVMDDVPYQDPS